MIDRVLFSVTFGSALCCGLVGGVFFAFSVFVMRALGRLPPAQGIAAMNSINVTVITPLFMIALFGMGLVCIPLAALAIMRWHHPGSALLLAGSILYFVGNIVVTAACNVPKNDALAATTPDSPAASALWANFLTSWTNWNHVRTITALAAAVLFTIALCRQSS